MPALLIVDVQNDFCPGRRAGGAAKATRSCRCSARLAARFAALGLPVYASRDWHPSDSRTSPRTAASGPSTACRAPRGHGFARTSTCLRPTDVVTKGQTREDRATRAMDGRIAGRGSFAEDLRARGVDRLYVGGLATDYCVRHSVLDALKLGFDVTLLTDAVRSVDVTPGDGARALDEMRQAGAELSASTAVFADAE